MSAAARFARGWSRSGTTLNGIEPFAGADGLVPVVDGANILRSVAADGREARHLESRDFRASGVRRIDRQFRARGHLVAVDLVAALDWEQLTHAVLDVFETEPLPQAHPFRTLPGVTILPHVAAPTTRPPPPPSSRMR